MQAAPAAKRICFAITHPRVNVTFPPKHGLTCLTSPPNLVTTGQNLGQSSFRQEPAAAGLGPERLHEGAGSVAIP